LSEDLLISTQLGRLSMRSRLSRIILPVVFLFVVTAFSSAAVKNRIASVNANSRVALPHTIPPRALNGTDLGEVSGSHQLPSLMLTFSMTDAQQAELTQLLIDQQDPNSPRYHQWLTPEQFGAEFGLSTTDIAQVSSWLSSQGFTITGVSPSSNYITFSGSAAQVKQAFGVTIHSLNVGGEAHISNLTDPVLPSGIAAVVTNLSGLNDFKLKSRAHTRTVKVPVADSTTGVHPDYTSSITGNHYIAPGDFYTIYNVNPLLSSSINGQGISIAVMGQTDINLSDVTAFRTASNLCTTVSSTCPNPLPTVKLYGSDPGTSSSDIGEAMLDVEWAGAVAPSASIIYVNSTNVFNSLISAITNNLAPIISISYGDCESDLGTSSINQLNQYFQQANAQGQTIVGPTGDSGATDCDFTSYPAVGGLAVDFPASSPFVTAAGGTMFNEGSATGATTYWSSNSSSGTNNAGSALSYIPETVWNESSSTNGLGAGGGGTSIYFAKPYWQLGLTPNDSARDLPDIALNAASNHDATLYCVQGSCVNGTFRASDGQSLTVVGGTSVATPSFAGVLALIEQKAGSRLGNIGPELYALASTSTIYSSAFHDITSGNNNSVCTPGTPNCPASGIVGYSAGTGYDLATGWGSVNVSNLANAWNQVAPIHPGSGVGTATSTLSLSTASPVCGVTGASQAMSLSVHVTSSIAGNTPTGTITILVDNVATSTTATLTGGAAALTLNTGTLTSGFHTVSAVYSGDAVNASSKSSITADTTSSTVPDFALTASGSSACSPAVTTLHGTAASAITFNVAALNGFTGPVTFTANSVDNVNATYTFTPTSVTNSGTTSFVLYAYATSALSIPSNGLTRLQTAKQETPRAPWYLPASGATLACALFFVLPSRRRLSTLLAIIVSVATLGSAIGCGSSSTTNNGGGGGGTTTTPAAPGTYNILVTATANTATGLVAHSVNVTFTVQ
jgi:subtilase family serine protease